MLTKEEAIKQRREVQKSLKGNKRKAHYSKCGDAGFYVWIDSLEDVKE
jgi:hypothetical protein